MIKIYDNVKICKSFKHKDSGDVCDFTFINADIEVGENIHIAVGCKIIGRGKVIIGDNVSLAPNVLIYTSVPTFRKGTSNNIHCDNYNEDIANVIIEDNVFIGASCIISQGVKIKKGCVIRANTYIGKHKVVSNG